MEKEIAIAWTDMTFSVKSILTRKVRIILNQVNGSVNFGSLNALMGPSGAGKTTLLKCINGKNSSGLSEKSKLYLNSKEKIRSCLIGHNEAEHLIIGLTTKQNLIYSSKLKNSSQKININHENNVNNLLSEMMTTDIANTKVEKCSGGEQRRISIALELTSHKKPNILCIDEPTSGLDSNAAETVIEYLKLLSRKHNISIITSIHQPNSDVLLMFDKLYVLAKGGVCVYSGPPQELSLHLYECDITCNEFQVPIEVLLKIASKGLKDKEVLQLSDKNYEEKQIIKNKSENEVKVHPNGIPFKSKNIKLIDMWYLLLRTMTYTYVTHWRTLLIQLVFYMFCPLIMAKTVNQNIGKPDGCFDINFNANRSCFKQLEEDSRLDQNIKFQAFTAILIMFIQICTTTLTFPLDIKVFLKEHQNKWYSTGTFFISKNIVEIIPTIVYSICYSVICYYSSGQIFEWHRLLWYSYTIIIGMLCAQGLGYLIGITLIKYEQLAIGVSIGLYLMMCMFCNIFTPLKEMPHIFQAMSDISFPKFIYYSVIMIIYGFNRCPTDQISILYHKYDLVDNLFFVYVNYLIIYCISLRILAFIILYVKVNTFVNRSKSKNLLKKLLCLETLKSQTPEVFNKRFETQISVISTRSEFSINIENTTEVDLNIKKDISISWIDMTLKTERNIFTDEKIILRELNGFIEFGTINALMGPSGAGKTSFLRSLNGRYNNLMTGETQIYLSKFEKIKTCFINQDVSEHLTYGLTAMQTLIYASKLKNPDIDIDHERNAKKLMNHMMIRDIANTYVQNCSSGERKRLVMAMELTAQIKPNLLCIDEPTSGLDSNAAEVVISCLKILSRNYNISIVTSIHQPNSDVLLMFDKLYVLAKGGVCVYSGPPKELISHLNECKITCNEFQVPIEVLLKHSCNGFLDEKVVKLSEIMTNKKQEILDRCKTETTLSPDGIQFTPKRFKFVDLWYLLLRIMTYTYEHNWKILVFKLILFISFGYALRLLFNKDIGSAKSCKNLSEVFENVCHKSNESLAEESLLFQNMSYNFLVIILFTFMQIVITTLTFTLDVKTFINEHRNGWYSTGVHYWAKSIEELIPTIITIIAYIYTIDIFNSKTIFFSYLILLTIGVLCVQSIGHIIAIIHSKNLKIAVLFSVTLYLLQFFLSNYFVPIKELHYSIQWFSSLSTVKLLYESIIILFFGFNQCSGTQFSSVMFVFGLTDSQFYNNIRILIYQLIVLRIICLIVLTLKVNQLSNNKSKNVSNKLVIESVKHSKGFIPGFNSENIIINV